MRRSAPTWRGFAAGRLATEAASSAGGRAAASAGPWTMRRSTTVTGGPSFEYRQQSEDDPRLRKTCTTCGFISYENPKVVCGSVLTIKGARGGNFGGGGLGDVEQELFVLGRRTIRPRRGCWGIPAGFLEMGETGEQGASREAKEEINAEIAVGRLLAVYSLPHIGQMQMIYSSVLKDIKGPQGSLGGRGVSAGQETDEVIAVRWEDIPWDSLAFPTTSWALWHHRLRAEAAAAAAVDDEAIAGITATEQPPTGLIKGVGAGAGADAGAGTGAGGVGGGKIANGSMAEPAAAAATVSQDTVFATPSANSSLFWSPERGLHLKDDWNVATDS